MRCLKDFMKISIGTNIKDGPWGGGNLFAINLKNYLINSGHDVVTNLDDNDIDLILLTEPRKTSESSAFTHIDILKYRQFVKNDVIVVHRINECDERKNSNYVNQYLIEANKVADATVFVSTWLKNLFINNGLENNNLKVILSGANNEIFNSNDNSMWDGLSKIKITTHHWGANWNKGFEIYQKLDEMISKEKYKDRVAFTYIGNLPKKFKFVNSTVIEPLSGKPLADKIKENYIYLTASINEPSGNHHIEAAQCGLPILFIDSGGIPEYCEGFGVKFSLENFEQKLDEIIDSYQHHQNKMTNYPLNSVIMSKNYETLFTELYAQRNNLKNQRKAQTFINIFEKYIYLISRRIHFLWKRFKPTVFK